MAADICCTGVAPKIRGERHARSEVTNRKPYRRCIYGVIAPMRCVANTTFE
jgi:hypothetical protein